MMMPTDLKSLIEHLRGHPHVLAKGRGGRPDRGLMFTGHHDGGLWFRDAAGQGAYVPIDCGMVASETGVEFYRDRFVVNKFGASLTYLYLPD